ncbi:MAG TPA: hypoxanthine phosphoribosyltransferase [Deltaproteobacteria bacterium]|jgi:hypoxanthine phosphoribosyltransferase|nr:hypoxanthine phosphoribosyltransferase [Deltaproteobacteria bacterium]HIJ77026.1 hypoxanthine phosphoribosyltransferase [Deltaproteobacteria bacterium]
MADYQLSEIISPDQLSRCVDHLAKRINLDYKGKNLVLIGILKGAFIFMADLARRLDLPVKLDFVRLASYGDKSQTCGNVRITKDVELPLQGSHVLVVEDIVDSGVTLKWFLDYVSNLGPESVKVCALLDKLERREVEVPIDYIGMTVAKGFLVGYGLDFSENHRNLPAIYEVVFDKTVSGQYSSAEGK